LAADAAPLVTPLASHSGAQEWAAIIAATELQGAARQLAAHCVLVGREGAVVRLALDPRSKFMRTAAVEEKLAQALTKYYGEPIRLEFSAVLPQAETPAQADQRVTQEEAESARRAFEADPGVQGFRDRFGATMLPDTIRPLKQ
jgi:DNA polymerase III subunit gamma/tau